MKFLISIVLIGAICGTLYWYLNHPIASEIKALPGSDNVPEGARNRREQVNIGEFFTLFNGTLVGELNSQFSGVWSNFRGADYSNIVKESLPLIDDLKEIKSRIKWQVKLGEGHSGAVIYKGVVYLLDYDETEKADMLRAFSLVDGSEIWRRWYKIDIKRNHGFSRTVPAVNDDVVVTIGPKCQVMAVDRVSGKLLWSIDLVNEYGSQVPQWYTGQCPMIDNGVVVLAAGGEDTLLMGVDAKSGEVLWKTPNQYKIAMSHASVVPMEFMGQKSYVYSGIGGVVGVSAEAENVGEVLWHNSQWTPSVIAPSPVVCGENKIYLTAGYGAGGAMLELTGSKAPFLATLSLRYKPKDGLSMEQQSAIYEDNRLYGIMPKDGGLRRMQFFGVETANLQEFTISGSRNYRFGLGPMLKADGKFYLLNDNGSMGILKIVNGACQVLDYGEIIAGQDAWAPIAYADGFMVMRDSVTMVCVDMKKELK